jgi:hypothetical protein
MNVSEPCDVIEQLCAEFMADQRARLSTASYRQYAQIMDLLELYLDYDCRLICLDDEHETTDRSDEGFCGVPSAVNLVHRLPAFLEDFLPGRIGVSTETLWGARMMIQELEAWLIARGSVVCTDRTGNRAQRRQRPPYFPGFFQD